MGLSPHDANTYVETYGSIRKAAKAAGIPRTTFQRLLKKAQKAHNALESHKIAQEATESKDDSGVIPPQKSVLEGHAERLGVSVDEISCVWEKTPEASVRIDKKHQQKFKDVGEHIQHFLKSSKSHVIRPCESRSEPCMLVIGLHDFHIGKLVWNKEAGEDYDLEIASTIYRQAVSDTLGFFGSPQVEKIVFPIGSDFFHSNSFKSETESGTRLDSLDDRMSKVFDCGIASVIAAIEDCVQIADVEVVWIPGNHESSWYLARALSLKYEGSPYVKVDHRDISRKYLKYGTNLIGMTHRTTKMDATLPLIMATEVPQEWAATTTRELHTGHLHTRREVRYSPVHEQSGVVFRILASLSATDAWHHENLFVGNLRAAESFLYSRESGYLGSRIAKVRK